MARYDGSTHSRCGCGEIIAKCYALCRACESAKRNAKYEAMPAQTWTDGPACIFDDDKYFFSRDDFFEWCEDEDEVPAAIRLVLCRPARMPHVDVDFFEEVLPEDCGEEVLPQTILDAMDALNAAIDAAAPLFWEPISVRVDMAELLEGGA